MEFIRRIHIKVEPAVLLVGASENPTIMLYERRGELKVLKLSKESIALLQAATEPGEVLEMLDDCREQLEEPLRKATGP